MLDSILDGLKGQAGSLLSDNGIGADKLDDVMNLSGESIKETALSEATGGNLDGVLGLLNGSGGGGIKDMIIKSLVGKLTSKLGLGDGIAGTLASSLIPKLLGGVTSKFNETETEDSAAGIASFLGGGGGLMDKAKGMLGDLF